MTTTKSLLDSSFRISSNGFRSTIIVIAFNGMEIAMPQGYMLIQSQFEISFAMHPILSMTWGSRQTQEVIAFSPLGVKRESAQKEGQEA